MSARSISRPSRHIRYGRGPRHRRLELAVEAPAVADDTGEEAVAGASLDRPLGLGEHVLLERR